MKPILIAENLKKKFSRNANQHLSYGLSDLFGEILGRREDDADELRKDEFWAVDDVSLSLCPGDSLALIGKNGSGKTTVLKMLNNLIKPDHGKIMVEGNVQALINLGAGFNPNLTGRDNIYNSAALRGLSSAQTKEIVDEIIDFAELGEFIDSPVGTYSSGMNARLGFSVAINLRPQIILIDEILSVGDQGFRNKCFIKMFELKKQGVTMVLVSHSHTQVIQFCDYAIWLEHGKVREFGKSKPVVEHYVDSIEQEEAEKVRQLNELSQEALTRPSRRTAQSIYGPVYSDFEHIDNLQVKLMVGGEANNIVKVHQAMTIRYSFDLKRRVEDLNVSINILRKDGLLMTTISTLNGDLLRKTEEGHVECEVTLPNVNLNPGDYVIVMPVHEGHSYLFRNKVAEFKVVRGDKMTWGVMSLEYDYKVESPEKR